MGGAFNSNFEFSKVPEGAVLGNIKQREKSFGVDFDVANSAVSLFQRFFIQGGPTFTTRMFSAIQNSLLRHLPQVAMMVNFGFLISALDLPQLVPPRLREEWRCALMKHSEQSVMWAGTNRMLKLLVVNLATTQQVLVCTHAC